MNQTEPDWQMIPPPSAVVTRKRQSYLTCPKQHRFATDQASAYGQSDQFL
jgi:hypothetical protein